MRREIRELRGVLAEVGVVTAARNLLLALSLAPASLVVPSKRKLLDEFNADAARHRPWFAPGLVFIHRANVLADVTLCGLPVLRGSSSNRPPIGIGCPRCERELRRAQRLHPQAWELREVHEDDSEHLVGTFDDEETAHLAMAGDSRRLRVVQVERTDTVGP